MLGDFGKEVKFVMTPGMQDFCEEIELTGYIIALNEIWKDNPIIGMHVFENFVEKDQLRLKVTIEGHDIKNNQWIAPTEVYKSDSLEIPKFWCITEDHGDFILATFLLPDEY